MLSERGKIKQMSKLKQICQNSYFIYTIAFILLLPCIYIFLILEGKSFILWGGGDGDGISQHYTSLVYLGEWLRNVLHTFFVEHSFAIPMWDMSIGFGADIITTLSYYSLGDPFALLSVFCPSESTEGLYDFLVILRLWFAGMAFLYYCRYNKSFDGLQDKGNFVLGALIYVFSAYPLRVLHPYFINPMIWFPLILVGVDKVLRGGTAFLYIGMLAVSAISNFYFFYMICIMVVIYTIFRYFMIIKDRHITVIGIWVGKFLLYSIWSVGISMIIMFPTVLSMLSSNRIGVKRGIPWVYPYLYYQEFLGTLIAPTINNYYTYLGYASIVVLTVGLILIDKKERLWAKYLGVLTVILLVPYLGCAMNGFVYATNRWVWAYGFLIAYITVKKLPVLFSRDREIKGYYWLLPAFYIGITLIFPHVRYKRVIMAAVILLMQMLLILLGNGGKIQKVYVRAGVFVLVGINLIMNSYFLYSPKQGNYVAVLGLNGTAWTQIKETAGSMMEDVADNGQYRYDTRGITGVDLMRNSAMLKDIMGTSFYFSTANDSVAQYQREMYLCNPMEQSFENLEGRNFLAALASVKYKIINKNDRSGEDYCFTELTKENEKYAMYADPYALPMVYSYDSRIARNNYIEMDVTRRQEAMMQGVVLEEESSMDETELVFQSQILPFHIVEESGLKYQDREIIVKEAGASLTLEFDGLSKSETYIIFKGIHYYTLDSGKGIFYQPQLSWKTKLKNRMNYFPGIHSASISVSADSVTKGVEIYTEENSYYCGHHDFLCNLGYSEGKIERVVLHFSIPGIYKMGGLSVACQPIEVLRSYKEKLNMDELQLDKKGNNQYICETESDKTKFVCFSIPYGRGWSAKLDGERVNLVRANTMFMGVEVPAGRHSITISYRTPGIIVGAGVTILSLGLYLIYWFRRRDKGYENQR